jgi:hypothetical protein
MKIILVNNMGKWYKDLEIGKYHFRVQKINDNKHKYIVWLITPMENNHILLSSPLFFGAYGMEQYKDKFKQYSDWDHNDEKRRELFRKRFRKLYEKNKDNPRSAIYWSWNYLW